MSVFSFGLRFGITQAGTIARSCLVPGQRGSVLAVFSKAIYFLTEQGELFWITTGDAPMHRRCAQLSSPLPTVTAGSLFIVDGHNLTIDNKLSFDVDQISLWSEPCTDKVVEVESLCLRVHTFFSNLDYSQAGGFGAFIPSILSLNQETPGDLVPEPADPILRYAHPFVMDTALACLERQSSHIFQCANALIGLGTGLTPSGDDFLGGMFFAIKMLRSNYPGKVLPDYIPSAETLHNRTHLISYTLLWDLVNGHAIAPLHQITNGLISGKPLEELHPYVSQLTLVGHSTGWDLLTGLLAGLLTMYQSYYCISSFRIIQNSEI